MSARAGISAIELMIGLGFWVAAFAGGLLAASLPHWLPAVSAEERILLCNSLAVAALVLAACAFAKRSPKTGVLGLLFMESLFLAGFCAPGCSRYRDAPESACHVLHERMVRAVNAWRARPGASSRGSFRQDLLAATADGYYVDEPPYKRTPVDGDGQPSNGNEHCANRFEADGIRCLQHQRFTLYTYSGKRWMHPGPPEVH